jgi:hypothetical protein
MFVLAQVIIDAASALSCYSCNTGPSCSVGTCTVTTNSSNTAACYNQVIVSTSKCHINSTIGYLRLNHKLQVARHTRTRVKYRTGVANVLTTCRFLSPRLQIRFTTTIKS